ncbi:MAG: 50S ribosomal protein L2 [Parcubacteria group bacterium ADurb.Bin326]|nr:MAG: 50S ribosomal protein L2 [Parcubacteria group bacterium ADurb.Bin326]
MPIKIYKPTTPSRRQTSVLLSGDISVAKPVKKLVVSAKRMAGRNNQGKISVRHQGGGARKKIRIIDFKRNKFDIPAVVASIEYDPNRNSRIALLSYADGEKRYIVAAEGQKVGDRVVSSQSKVDYKTGNCMPLEHIPAGMNIYNIELAPGRGGQLARSAGTGVILMGFDKGYAQVKMPSGEIRLISDKCCATIGQTSNPEFKNIRWGKAGRMRHRGIRPTVRGKVMNPVDHPHGGGEGVNPIGMKHPKTPWGKPALGVRTRRKKASSSHLILQRRPSRKKKK